MNAGHTPKATLPNYEGPLYPDNVGALATAFRDKYVDGMDDEAFTAIARGCPGFASIEQGARAADGYVWWRTVDFRTVDNGSVLVAIPCYLDRGRESAMPDRLPAVYIRNVPYPLRIDAPTAVVARLTRAIQRAKG